MTDSLLNEALIRSQISNGHYQQTLAIDILPSVSSTIDYIKAQYPAEIWPRVCLAEQQTQGRGQLNRAWHAPFATNINLSCALLFQDSLSKLEGLSLVIGLVVVQVLAGLGITEQLKIKWPNDIFWRGQKIAGLLVETEVRPNGAIATLISIGMNVNICKAAAEQISQPWTSLALILNQPQDRNRIAGKLLDQLFTDLEVFTKQGFAAFLPKWQPYDYLHDQTVTLTAGQKSYLGKAIGINARGHLLLQATDGSITAHATGHIGQSYTQNV